MTGLGTRSPHHPQKAEVLPEPDRRFLTCIYWLSVSSNFFVCVLFSCDRVIRLPAYYRRDLSELCHGRGVLPHYCEQGFSQSNVEPFSCGAPSLQIWICNYQFQRTASEFSSPCQQLGELQWLLNNRNFEIWLRTKAGFELPPLGWQDNRL